MSVASMSKQECSGEHAPIAVEAQEAVPSRDVAIDRELVPRLGMADIADLNVIVLSPEDRNVDIFLAVPEHVERRDLPLALGNHPMLDANYLATRWIGWSARGCHHWRDCRHYSK
jgi:hypothetical protein